MKLPIGYDDFRAVVENRLDFVDKSLFIKQVIDDNAVQVAVITRPRRFGKTLNLSMLHNFLAKEVNGQPTRELFEGLEITKVNKGKYLKYQGKYPVIFVSLKSIKDACFRDALTSLRLIIQKLYRTHRYLMTSSKLEQDEKELFEKFLTNKIDKATLETGLEVLSEFLYKHNNKKVYILIDEYDIPVQSGYLNGYYDEMINLIQRMFGAALKSNPYLERSIMTGILRIAKESIFSGLNNVTVYSLLHPQYSQYFGFTEEEVAGLLKQANLNDKGLEIRKWYNGYVFGERTVYNPWSIVNCINNNGLLKPYWANTCDNQLIKNLLIKSDAEFKEQFESLLLNKPIVKFIDDNTVFGNLKDSTQGAWSFLVMSGYLKILDIAMIDGMPRCKLAIPNCEVKALYRTIIYNWLGSRQGIEWYQSFLSYLLQGNIEKFIEHFGQILAQTISVYDVAHNPDAFYHGFLLGLAAGLNQEQYELKSNRESGAGRYDISIIPKDISKPAIILEIKSLVMPKLSKRMQTEFLDKNLMKEAQKALKQIDHNQYTHEIVQREIVSVVKIGLAFSEKYFRVASGHSHY